MKPHEHVATFGTMDGELRVGGMPLSRLAASVGSTPFFAYDRGLLDERLAALRAALPAAVELKVAETEPGIQGDRVSGATKPATLETGAEIQVPLFLETGTKVKVDTRDGSYLGRAS